MSEQPWKKDMKKSNQAFVSLVWPIIRNSCGGGEIMPVELMQDNELARSLDVDAGIDVWQTLRGEGVRGIASRVQFCKKSWDTFTIRKSRGSGVRTELQKRGDAIKSGRFVFPFLTCQAYVDEGAVIGVGLAKTEEIFNAYWAGKFTEKPYKDTWFVIVKWSDVAGCKPKHFSKQDVA